MANNDIKALNTAFNIVADYVSDISTHFGVEPDQVKLDFCSNVFGATVTIDVKVLAERWQTSADFERFCNKNKLYGVISYNKDGTLTFHMSPNEGKPTSDSLD